MAGKIFINYRREDSIAVAGRLHDRLAETFGRDNLFMDVDNIPVGINFEEYLKSQVAACDVILSVIGPNWLNAKDETDQRRLDKPDDFVAIEIAAALARNILVIPVLVDGTHMPKASELPGSLKPLALRNAIQVRNTNFGSDAEQLITKLREALALGRPERTQNPGLTAHLVAAFLLNIGVFLFALIWFFFQSNNNAGSLASFVAALPVISVGTATLVGDQRVRMFGLVTTIAGLLAVAAVIVSGQFFQVGLFADSSIQSAITTTGIYFVISVMFFASGQQDQQWKTTDTETPTKATKIDKILERIGNSRWWPGLCFLGVLVMVNSNWMILYRLTDSTVATLALVGVQVLVVGSCYVRYLKALAANPAPAPS